MCVCVYMCEGFGLRIHKELLRVTCMVYVMLCAFWIQFRSPVSDVLTDVSTDVHKVEGGLHSRSNFDLIPFHFLWQRMGLNIS